MTLAELKDILPANVTIREHPKAFLVTSTYFGISIEENNNDICGIAQMLTDAGHEAWDYDYKGYNPDTVYQWLEVYK